MIYPEPTLSERLRDYANRARMNRVLWSTTSKAMTDAAERIEFLEMELAIADGKLVDYYAALDTIASDNTPDRHYRDDSRSAGSHAVIARRALGRDVHLNQPR